MEPIVKSGAFQIGGQPLIKPNMWRGTLKKISRIILVALISLLASSVYAEGSYVGFGFGLHFGLGELSNTIAKDGLDSSIGKPALTGATVNLGAGQIGCFNVASGPNTTCLQEQPGNSQKLIIGENELIARDKIGTNLFQSKTTGPMIGGVFDVFYESEGTNTFWRVGLSYTQKIRGGHSEDRVLGIKWYDIDWNYKSVIIPFYFGLKAGIGETASVYGGAGVNYMTGGWDVGGTNIGDIPTTLTGSLTGSVGAVTVAGPDGRLKGGALVGEAIAFRVKGIGFNFLLGLEKKTESGNKIFFEMDSIVGGGYGVTRSKTGGATQGLAPFPAYPISLGGTRWKFGYKIAM